MYTHTHTYMYVCAHVCLYCIYNLRFNKLLKVKKREKTPYISSNYLNPDK